jgi:hypothetical protein
MKVVSAYFNEKGTKRFVVQCPICLNNKDVVEWSVKYSKHGMCWDCFKKSDLKKKSMLESVKIRRTYSGQENPNFKGKLTKVCKCGAEFDTYPSVNSKYCSRKCKHQYSVSISKPVFYKDIKMRSSFEVQLAKIFDDYGFSWGYEPWTFATPFGFYTPDFYVKETGYFYEAKGFFRDENSRDKFEWLRKNNKACLVDEAFFLKFGWKYLRKKQIFVPVMPSTTVKGDI